ncbi:MAG TPA: fatty acyl-AMP ligase, partial [Acidimicrobiales bacterium]|nr:fatty acyl-AMP ligase [Acidimicrobiales bacterium]
MGTGPSTGTAQSLVGRLCDRAAERGERAALVFVGADGGEEVLTYAALDRRARALGARLSAGYPVASRGLVLCEPGLDYVVAFFGCLYGGMVPVPAYPPSLQILERSVARLRAIAADAGASFAVTTSLLAPFAGDMAVRVGGEAIEWLEVAEPGDAHAPDWAPAGGDPGEVAFLQYTSGSTGDPRGVMVTHANLVAHLGMIAQIFGVDGAWSGASWLPPYHDMGLIGGIMFPLWIGATGVLLSPETFLRRPLTWLRAISDHRLVWSPAPNFAFDLCVRHTTAEDRAALDLSSWRVAINGAEPVRAATLRAFIEAFGPAGFRPEAFWPALGLAEATLLATSGSLGNGASVVSLDPRALEAGRLAEAGPSGPCVEVVSCGHPPEGAEALVVDPARAEVAPPGQVGEIWLRGPHVAAGYWGRPGESEAAFGARLADGTGPFLRTGDLGALWRGELVVSGRMKDVIVVRGANHYPQDIEATMEGVDPGLRRGCGAAVAVPGATGGELVALVQEVAPDRVGDLQGLVDRMKGAIARLHEVRVDAVVLIAPRTIPKTSSGKIQRRATRQALLAGGLEVV